MNKQEFWQFNVERISKHFQFTDTDCLKPGCLNYYFKAAPQARSSIVGTTSYRVSELTITASSRHLAKQLRWLFQTEQLLNNSSAYVQLYKEALHITNVGEVEITLTLHPKPSNF